MHNVGAAVYLPSFTITHCTHPLTDGQAEFTCMAGYIPRQFVCPHYQTSYPMSDSGFIDCLSFACSLIFIHHVTYIHQ